MIYKLDKTRNKRTKDISDNIYINDADGNILTDHEMIKDRWQEYIKELFIVTNARKESEKCHVAEGPIPRMNNCRREKKTIRKVEEPQSQWSRQLTY